MHRFIYSLLILILLLPSKVLAQIDIVPHLGQNGLYGFADVNGKVLVPPLYEEVIFHQSGEFIIVKVGELYGVLDNAGQVILEPIMTTSRAVPAFSELDEYGNRKRTPRLYAFEDHRQKTVYYVNPYHPLDNYKQFTSLNVASSEIERFCTSISKSYHQMIRVAEDKSRINFMDTTGRLIFKEPIHDGKVLGARHMALRNEENLFALCSLKGELLTDYKFTVLGGSHRDWFTATVKVEEGNNYTQLLDAKGKVLLDNKKFISIRPNGLLIVREGDKDFIMNDKFEVLLGKGEREITHLDSLHFRIGFRDSMYVVDNNMDAQVEPIYTAIAKVANQKIYFEREGYSGFFDDQWNEAMAIPYKIMHVPKELDEPLIIIDFETKKNGVASPDGKVIIQPEYDKVRISKCGFTLLSGDEQIFVDRQGKELYRGGTDFKAGCYESFYEIYAGGERTLLDKQGQEVVRAPFSRAGIPVSPEMKQKYNFFTREDKLTRRQVKVGKAPSADKRYYEYILINERGDEILPDTYDIPQNYTTNYNGINGGFRVYNRSTNKSGVIDFDGNWLIAPVTGYFDMVGKELYTNYQDVENGLLIYDKYGKVISDKGYQFIEDDTNAKIHNDRITIGYLLNEKSFKATVERLSKIEDFREFLQAKNEAEKGKYLFGYMNTEGKEIIAPQYVQADPFTYSYTTVMKPGDDGQFVSSLIGLDGNELFSGAYDKLEIIRKDTTFLIATKDGKQGILNNKGTVIVPLGFDNLIYEDGMAISLDSTGLYFIDPVNFEKKQIGNGGDELTIKEIGSGYYLAKVITHNENTPRRVENYFVFTNEGRFLGDFTEHFKNSGSQLQLLSHVDLPNGIVKMTPSYKNMQPYYFNLETGKVYWNRH